MSPLVAALYLLCILFLVSFSIFVIAKDYTNPLNQYFSLLCLALLGWVGSLAAFFLKTSSSELLWIGRFNFAAVAVAVPLLYLFVRRLSCRPSPGSGWIWFLWIETAILTLVTQFLSAVDRAEFVTNGVHTTAYGPLFPLYILHVLVYVIAAVNAAFRPAGRVTQVTRNQLKLVGGGIIATAAIALFTNAWLPYVSDDFRFIHVGTISTILFLAAVGYAVFVYGLFDVHIVIRATFVFAGLIALALEVYKAAIASLVHLVPLGDPSERQSAATFITLVIFAFTQEPVKRWLESVARRIFRQPHNR
jgi:hypothetical protein